MKHQFMNKTNGKIASVLVMYLDDDGHMQTDGYDIVAGIQFMIMAKLEEKL